MARHRLSLQVRRPLRNSLRCGHTVLLFELLYYSLLNIDKVHVLQAGKLDELVGPHRRKLTQFTRSRCYGARDQVLVGVHELVVLQAQQRKEVNVALHECDGLDVRNELPLLAIIYLRVAGVEQALRHKYFHYVIEQWEAVKLKLD